MLSNASYVLKESMTNVVGDICDSFTIALTNDIALFIKVQK